MAKNLSNYVVKLLDHVRGNDELDIILNEEGDVPDLQEHGKLSRLKLALKFNEKHVSGPITFCLKPSSNGRLHCYVSENVWNKLIRVFSILDFVCYIS